MTRVRDRLGVSIRRRVPEDRSGRVQTGQRVLGDFEGAGKVPLQQRPRGDQKEAIARRVVVDIGVNGDAGRVDREAVWGSDPVVFRVGLGDRV